MKTILFVTARLPFPTISGRKTVMYHYCRILKQLGYRIVVASFLEKGDTPAKKPDFIDRLAVLSPPTTREKMKQTILDSMIKGNKPIQVSLFYGDKAQQEIDQILSEEQPDLIMADMIRTTEYLRKANCFKIADLDDMLSIRYARQLQADSAGANPYGAYLSVLPPLLQKVLMWKLIKTFVLKREIKLLEKYEYQMGEIFDQTIFVAEREAELLNKKIGKNKAYAVPLGVDADYFSEPTEALQDQQLYIGFLGAMSVAHNEHAAIHFITHIFPNILQQVPNAKLMIIGGGVTDKLKRLFDEHVYATGRVEDVRPYLKSCKVFVCPLQFGSGIKTKNLEAMVMGIPVVTTPVGAENINAVDGQDWLVADTDLLFAEKTSLLLTDETLQKQVAEAGRKFVLNNFTWEVAKEKFRSMLPK